MGGMRVGRAGPDAAPAPADAAPFHAIARYAVRRTLAARSSGRAHDRRRCQGIISYAGPPLPAKRGSGTEWGGRRRPPLVRLDGEGCRPIIVTGGRSPVPIRLRTRPALRAVRAFRLARRRVGVGYRRGNTRDGEEGQGESEDQFAHDIFSLPQVQEETWFRLRTRVAFPAGLALVTVRRVGVGYRRGDTRDGEKGEGESEDQFAHDTFSFGQQTWFTQSCHPSRYGL